MAVITKKNEKIAHTFNSLAKEFSSEEFIEKFKVLYPKDWKKIERNFKKHERKTKANKHHPMPRPNQYLRNALNVRQKNKITK